MTDWADEKAREIANEWWNTNDSLPLLIAAALREERERTRQAIDRREAWIRRVAGKGMQFMVENTPMSMGEFLTTAADRDAEAQAAAIRGETP